MKDVPHVHNEYSRIEVSPGFGFSAIPEQVRDASIKDGFVFNLLVVGRRGLGSTTLVNSLFSSSLIQRGRSDSIATVFNELIENGIKLSISITTYHGNDFLKIFKLLDSLNNDYFENEQGLNVPFEDKRIHAALYLVPGDMISQDEIEGIRELSARVNLIPVITKADMFTTEELEHHRTKINEIFKSNGIMFYDYGETEQFRFPMAVIASETEYKEDGACVLGRKYPWGFVDIENEKYSDFKRLQRILICECFEDLIYQTDAMFYNRYRRLLMGSENGDNSRSRVSKLVSQMEQILDQKFSRKLRDLEGEEISIMNDLADKLSVRSGELSYIQE